jgi:hypothetical protein
MFTKKCLQKMFTKNVYKKMFTKKFTKKRTTESQRAYGDTCAIWQPCETFTAAFFLLALEVTPLSGPAASAASAASCSTCRYGQNSHLLFGIQIVLICTCIPMYINAKAYTLRPWTNVMIIEMV